MTTAEATPERGPIIYKIDSLPAKFAGKGQLLGIFRKPETMKYLWLLLLCVFSVQTQAADDDYDDVVIFYRYYQLLLILLI